MYRTLLLLSRGMAVLGGIMLLALIFLTVFGIVGRLLDRVFHWMTETGYLAGFGQWMIGAGVGPMLGTFELIEAGVAFVIFAFLPVCQITGGHATVDIFTLAMPERVNRVLRGTTELVFAFVMVLIALQLFGGLLTKYHAGQTTLELQLPVWYSYAIGFAGAALAAIVSVYQGLIRFIEILLQRDLLPPHPGAER